jgi:AraC-like DNA-binding protein
MSLIRGTCLTGYPQLVAALGGDVDRLLAQAGLRRADIGRSDVFLPYRAVIEAIESAAAATGTADFGRRLATRQGIEILGPVGAAAKTSATASEALEIFGCYMSAYSPAIRTVIRPLPGTQNVMMELHIDLDDPPAHPQTTELSLGLVLRICRLLFGQAYAPVAVHIPHQPLGDREGYVDYFGCSAAFAEPVAGCTFKATDLSRPLDRDDFTHQTLVEYLRTIVGDHQPGIVGSISHAVRQLLPTGAVTLDVIADQFKLHPKTLQRRLAAEGTTFATVVDQVRRETAEHYLRHTEMTLPHLTRELGYSEQSVLTRSCRRWFGHSPTSIRTGTGLVKSPGQAGHN